MNKSRSDETAPRAAVACTDLLGQVMAFITGGLDVEGGRDSIGPRIGRSCPQKVLSLSVTRRDHIKTPRWHGLDGVNWTVRYCASYLPRRRFATRSNRRHG